MFEFHGWVTVQDTTAWDDEPADDPSPATLDRVRALLEDAQDGFGAFDLRVSNASWHVWLAGLRNHRQQRVIDLFKTIAEIAPGSYGLLHVQDDEHPYEGDDWICWTMVRGRVEANVEARLSPAIP